MNMIRQPRTLRVRGRNAGMGTDAGANRRGSCHQPPEVNYIEVFENSDLPQDVYSQSRHPVKTKRSEIGVDRSLLVAGGGLQPAGFITAKWKPTLSFETNSG
jgi:hypothetical protein